MAGSEKVLHGWFSQKQKEVMAEPSPRRGDDNGKREFKASPTSIYLTPSGEEVEITEVGKNPNNPSSLFDDFKYVGVVTKWLRHT